MSLPPSAMGAIQSIFTLRSPGVPARPVGAPGATTSVIEPALAADEADSASAEEAVTVTVWVTPGVSEVNVAVVTAAARL